MNGRVIIDITNNEVNLARFGNFAHIHRFVSLALATAIGDGADEVRFEPFGERHCRSSYRVGTTWYVPPAIEIKNFLIVCQFVVVARLNRIWPRLRRFVANLRGFDPLPPLWGDIRLTLGEAFVDGTILVRHLGRSADPVDDEEIVIHLSESSAAAARARELLSDFLQASMREVKDRVLRFPPENPSCDSVTLIPRIPGADWLSLRRFLRIMRLWSVPFGVLFGLLGPNLGLAPGIAGLGFWDALLLRSFLCAFLSFVIASVVYLVLITKDLAQLSLPDRQPGEVVRKWTQGSSVHYMTGRRLRFWEATGGRLFLTNRRLVFCAHEGQPWVYVLRIPLDHVARVERFNLCANGLIIETKEGRRELFNLGLMNSNRVWTEEIERARAT